MAADRTSGREAVLAAIRQSLGRPELSPDARRELQGRIDAHAANLVPERGRLDRARLLELFVQMAEGVACTVERLAGAEDIPAAVAAYLREHNLPPELAMAPDPWLAGLDWASQPLLTVRQGRPRNEDHASLTPAFAGVAETGTLVMTSGPDHPTTLNFMPDHHIVALRTSQVVGAYEEAWAQLREAYRQDDGFAMPRTVNMITGPSRTGDIELTIHLGAHGPRSLHILLIDDEAAQP